jgi:hypothetical protein
MKTKLRENEMAISSITHNFIISDSESVKRFAAALIATVGAVNDERFWTLACLAGAFALMGISHVITFQNQDSRKKDEKKEKKKER